MDKPQLSIDWTDFVHRVIDLVLPRSDDILTSPSKIGELLSLCAELADIEPMVREIATALAMQKREVLGWTLVHRDGHRYVPSEAIAELVSSTPAKNLYRLLEVLTRQLGNISEGKYRDLCLTAGLETNSAMIAQSGATVSSDVIHNHKP